LTQAKEFEQVTGKSLAAQSIVTPLISMGVVNHLLDDAGKMMNAAKKGNFMYAFKARELASAISEGLRQAFEDWNAKISTKYDIDIYDYWNIYELHRSMTYRATGRNKILTIMQNVSQLLTEKGFRVDFVWERVSTYYTYSHTNKKEPDTEWGTDYDSKRTITIFHLSREAYPELELPEFLHKDKNEKKKAWMQVRPAMNVRWEAPNEDEVKVLADKMLYELTATKEEQALDKAENLGSEDRMLRIGGSPTKRSLLIPLDSEDK